MSAYKFFTDFHRAAEENMIEGARIVVDFVEHVASSSMKTSHEVFNMVVGVLSSDEWNDKKDECVEAARHNVACKQAPVSAPTPENV